ncbi:hypothetical protein LZD49_05135 [Dyadobacter sp. CY261]|uniref:hypothetical protein n=1 Tax=Dyadobacter sp. CY261 TaxID=2907203 RepID=UPI001F27E9FF|nr:hypothetical protein [Dyadobacter sp. CY261]MCF0069845.1 hypothetical protein [Dyadobacter sp. CY261]
MRKLLRNIILFIVILDTTSLCQVYKAPLLLKHFAEHQSLNHEITFTDFLSMHYLGKDLNDDDDDKDMQLPFKKVEAHTSSFIFVPNTPVFTFKRAYLPIKAEYGPAVPQVDYSTVLGALFRPPRA